MDYLKFIESRIQGMSEDLAGAFGLDITVVDQNLLHIAGTGRFQQRIRENSPENSIFAQVMRSGMPAVNVRTAQNSICKECPNFRECEEMRNITVPILIGSKTIGVIGLAAFNEAQSGLLEEKSGSLLKFLTQMAQSVSKDVVNIRMLNRINIGKANINELINSINQGIVIVNSVGKISHINSAALSMLGIDLAGRSVVGCPLAELIGGIRPTDSQGKDIYDDWTVDGIVHRIKYRSQEVILNSEKVSTLISFDEQKLVVQAAAKFCEGVQSGFDAIIGECPAILSVIEQAKIAARTNSTIHIRGESGTGKELLVRAIHSCSDRRNKPLITVNCSAIPESLMESELFGYEHGAFTGADPKGKPGKFELANGGILFLDEIGDLPIHLQPKLLRVLQEKEVIRIGSSRPVKLDVKVISATHKEIFQMVQEKKFREDLYYRLNVIPLTLPPLRDRSVDIMLCANFLTGRACEKLGVPQKSISQEVSSLFQEYRWPGNLRELENVVEYAANFTDGDEICIRNLPPYFSEAVTDMHGHLQKEGPSIPGLPTLSKGSEVPLRDLTEQFEREVIGRYVEYFGDTTEGKKQVAQALNISLTTLYRKL